MHSVFVHLYKLFPVASKDDCAHLWSGGTDIWQPNLGVGPVPHGDSLLHMNVPRLKACIS